MSGKERWIIEYISQKKVFNFVDMLDEEFVNAFVYKYNANFEPSKKGASRCQELSTLLAAMYKKGLLIRFARGVRDNSTQDEKLPRWVYAYKLRNNK